MAPSLRDLLTFMSFLLLCAAADPDAPKVHTKYGSLQGKYVGVKGTEAKVQAFLGVPFAKPPVGPTLRLAAPQPAVRWEGVRDATQQPPMCIQSKEIVLDLLEKLGGMVVNIPEISEDCLYLNIYTPANKLPDAKLPVMVWIHGGGFTLGSASMFDGSALAAYQDVVVVLIQYRLGTLGFLSTGDEHVTGNYGLLDQIEALRWINEHIGSFGGDPNSVTVFGESAGGASVSLLLLSPLSKGLIHRGIAESGTATMDFLVKHDPAHLLQTAKQVANLSGCSSESPEEIAACMKTVDIDTIIPLSKDPTLRFLINVDGQFLKRPVPEVFQNHEVLNVPFMTGVNDDEGGWMLASFFAPANWTEGMDRELIVNFMGQFYPDPKDAYIIDLILNYYGGTGEDRVKNRDAFTQLLGDTFFLIPAINAAKAHRDVGVPVYLYEYRHPPSFLKKNRPDFVGADHGDELFTVMGFCFTTTDVTVGEDCPEEEKELSRIMMQYWANFARTGSPNDGKLAHWPTYGANEEYLVIDSKKQSIARHLKKDKFDFMTKILPEKIRLHKESEDRSEL